MYDKNNVSHEFLTISYSNKNFCCVNPRVFHFLDGGVLLFVLYNEMFIFINFFMKKNMHVSKFNQEKI